MKLILPKFVTDIIGRLQTYGYEAYVVGGCVRDSLLGLNPSDWDVCTGALPRQVIDLFTTAEYRCIPTGIRHGTITVISDSGTTEITTFRADQNYTDHRRPETVLFSDSLQQDLARRDFTVNAMAWNSGTGLVDPFGGMADLNSQMLQCVGDPQERFSEDALRILRLFRFAAQLNFEMEPTTLQAAENLRSDLSFVSNERTGAEFTRLLCAQKPGRVLAVMEQTGVLQQIVPLSDAFRQKVNPDCWNPVDSSDADEAIRYAVFLRLCLSSPVSADAVQTTLKHLRRSGKLTLRVRRIFEAHDTELRPNAGLLRRLLAEFGEQSVRDLIKVRRAFAGSDETGMLLELSDTLDTVLSAKPCLQVSDLNVNGSDMMALGLTGPEIGRMLHRLLSLVLDDPAYNDRNILLHHACNLLKGQETLYEK